MDGTPGSVPARVDGAIAVAVQHGMLAWYARSSMYGWGLVELAWALTEVG
jgi:hypothetical protein